MFDQHRFSGAVALVHPTDLRQRGVRLIDDEQIVLGEEIEKGVRTRACRASREMAGVVFDTRAEAHFLHHFQVVLGAHFDALGFEQLALRLEPGDAPAQFLADGQQGGPQIFGGRHELFGRVNPHRLERLGFFARQGLEARQPLDFVAEEFHPQRILPPGRAQFHRVAAHAELAADKFNVVARILKIHKPAQEMVARHFFADADGDHHRLVIFLAADAVDA